VDGKLIQTSTDMKAVAVNRKSVPALQTSSVATLSQFPSRKSSDYASVFGLCPGIWRQAKSYLQMSCYAIDPDQWIACHHLLNFSLAIICY